MKAGWEKKVWNDVLKILNGKNQKAVEDINGKYPIYGSGGIMGYANDYICPEHSVIVGRKGNIDKPIYVDCKFWNVDTAFGLVANSDILNSRYLFYFCKVFNFQTLNKAVTIPSLTKSDLLKINMLIPPIDEQLAIVAELDSLSSIIAKHKQLAEEYDRLEQSIFHDMFGDPVTNEKGWEVKKLGELTKEKPTYGSMASAVEYDGETRYVRITDIDNNGDLLPNKMSPSIVEDKYLLKDGDIVFARSGATVGKTYCYMNTNERMIYAGYLIKFVPDDKYVLPIYLSFYTKTDFYKAFIQSNAQAVAHPNINAKQYSSLDVFVPPLSLQTLFAEKIQHIEALKSANSQAQKEAETLFAERMNYYFGE